MTSACRRMWTSMALLTDAVLQYARRSPALRIDPRRLAYGNSTMVAVIGIGLRGVGVRQSDETRFALARGRVFVGAVVRPVMRLRARDYVPPAVAVDGLDGGDGDGVGVVVWAKIARSAPLASATLRTSREQSRVRFAPLPLQVRSSFTQFAPSWHKLDFVKCCKTRGFLIPASPRHSP
jgi:hypothetical protein